METLSEAYNGSFTYHTLHVHIIESPYCVTDNKELSGELTGTTTAVRSPEGARRQDERGDSTTRSAPEFVGGEKQFAFPYFADYESTFITPKIIEKWGSIHFWDWTSPVIFCGGMHTILMKSRF